MESNSVADAPSSPVTSGRFTLGGSYAHPMQTIADDLLAEVFYRSCQFPEFPIAERDWSDPFVLSSVCRRWRDVSLSAPYMWSYVNERLEMQDEGITNFKLARITTWITRSKAVPLHVILDIKLDEEAPRLEAVIDLIDLCKMRLVSLILRMDGYGWPIPTMNLTGLQNLHQMAVIKAEGGARPGDPPFVTWHIDMTALSRIHTLTLSGLYLTVDVNEPLSALVSLDFHLKTYTAADCLKLLPYTPRLEKLSLYCNMSPRPSVPCPHVQLDHLHDLHVRTIEGYSSNGIPGHSPSFYFLDYLTSPALTHLKLSYPANSEHALLNFLSRVQPPLQSLKIHLWCLEIMDIHSVLHLLPNLVILKLYTHKWVDGDDFDPFARRLILHPNTDTNVCPNLEEIYFIGCHWCSMDIESTARMITSRWIGDANIDQGEVRNGKLRKAHLLKSNNADFNSKILQLWDMEDVTESVEEGLDLNLGE